MIVLVDQDGVLANFEKRVLEIYRKLYPDKPFVSLDQLKNYNPEMDYPENVRHLVRDIYHSPNFFLSLEPIDGSIKALNEIQELGHEVYICTSPLSRYEDCVLEKYSWVDKYLGSEWTKKLIVTKDKTLVYGDFLIDDRPEISGLIKPSWEHILYTQPYNQNVEGKRRLTWKNWKEVLDI